MEKVLIVEDEKPHQEMFKAFITLAYKRLGKEVEVCIAGTVMEAFEHTQDAVMIVLDANFPNDMLGSQKLAWMEVIDNLNGRESVTLYPSSSEPDNNEAMRDYSEKMKGIRVLRKNGKHAKDLFEHIIKIG